LATLKISLKESASIRFLVYDPRGQRIKERDINLLKGANTIEIDLSGFDNGIYYMDFEFEDGSRFLKKLLVKH
ncbi:MAG: T9SS type A sorting domain-containing protein, partial [Bacteroidales bacterium]|nr:T9SS type A sorting domain-containing protein [Bacteroidales bacterium]